MEMCEDENGPVARSRRCQTGVRRMAKCNDNLSASVNGQKEEWIIMTYYIIVVCKGNNTVINMYGMSVRG